MAKRTMAEVLEGTRAATDRASVVWSASKARLDSQKNKTYLKAKPRLVGGQAVPGDGIAGYSRHGM
jgi:hypothetical protein